MRNEYYIEIKKQKDLFIENYKQYISIFKQYGYIIKFNFQYLGKNKNQCLYVITEIHPEFCLEDKKNSKYNIIFVSKFLSYNINTDEINVYNTNLQKQLNKVIENLKSTEKPSLSIFKKFKLYLFYPKIFKKYYKDIFSPAILICFIIFILIISIMDAQAKAHWKYEIFGIGANIFLNGIKYKT